ncbi:SusC/RagA family TonB-linked outer membrane protein [Cloacibacterium sp.]|uniref:SusC/RagA family TonB-linked outer membrane protein n=1 Tax=Cloacibacterium sp. TaxID=1913682 RepID=UPI0039E49A65
MRNFNLTRNKAAVFFAMTLLPTGFIYSQTKKDSVKEKKIQEVVLVGYGSMQKKNVTGAITTVSSEVISKTPVPNAMEAVRGQVAGLRVTRSSGQPGQGLSFQLRGAKSINLSTKPLIVIDGIPVNDSNLAEFNSEDIQDISVLKDLGAAAIYGVQGSNGVVLITTKKGRKGKPEYSFDSSIGIVDVLQTPRLMNADQYVQYRIDGKRGLTNNYIGVSDVISDPISLNNYAAGKSVDWNKLLIKTGTQNNYNFSVRGADDKFSYYMNANAYLEDGVIVNSDYKRYSFRLNTDYKATDRLTVGANINYSTSNADERGLAIDARSTNQGFVNFVNNSPLGSVYNADGSLTATITGSQFQYNPLFRYQQSKADREVRHLVISPYLEFKIMDGLTYRLNTAFDSRDELYRSFYSSLYDSGNRTGLARKITINNGVVRNYLVDNILTYRKKLGEKHDIGATIVAGFQKISGDGHNTVGNGSAADPLSYDLLGYYGMNTMSNDNTESRTWNSQSSLAYFVGRFNYTFADKYVLTASVRRDGTSVFANGNKWGTFPSVSLAWNADRESFLSGIKNLDLLKFRLSYATGGNQQIPGSIPLPDGSRVYINSNFPYLTLATATQYPFGGTLNTGYIPNSQFVGNSGIHWETSKQFNAGVDFGLFGNRISGSVEYYKSKNTDNILGEIVPIVPFGASSTISNVGQIDNNGIEVTLKADILRANSENELSWTINANWTRERNKLVKLARNNVDANGNPVHDWVNNWFIGYQLGTYPQYVYEGVYQIGEEAQAQALHGSTWGAGAPKIKDVNGDGKITLDDRVFYNPNPDWYGGFGSTFTYKNFQLDFLIEAVIGGDKINSYLPTMNTGVDNNAVAVNYWTPTNTSGDYPMPEPTNKYAEFNNSWRIQDASYVTIRNVSLGYTLPKKYINQIGFINNLNIYVRGNNLYYFTKMRDTYSPENNFGTYPITRVFTFGVKATF